MNDERHHLHLPTAINLIHCKRISFAYEAATAHTSSKPNDCFHSFAIMSTNWDWTNTVQQPTTEQKQVPPTSSYQMNSWNAPQTQSPQEREAPAMMYQTGSPGARADPYSPGNNNQLQPVQTTGYQNYQLGGGQQFMQQQQHAAQYSSPSPPVSPVKDVPPTPPPVTNLPLVPSQPEGAANMSKGFATATG